LRARRRAAFRPAATVFSVACFSLDVADFEGVLLVVRCVFLRAHDVLLVDGVHDAPLDAHDDGLVLHVAHHHALENSLRHIQIAP